MTTSDHYRKLTTPTEIRAAQELGAAWQDERIPERQWNAIANERAAIMNGTFMTVAPFSAFINACLSAPYEPTWKKITMLDVGASSGLYHELLRSAGFLWDYTALDYSPAFRDWAARVLPHVPFILGDARHLQFPPESFDIVVSSCVLIHLSEWKETVAEAARVSRRHVIFHRTPLLKTWPTTYWSKEAYGIPCLEVWYGAAEFEELLRASGLTIVSQHPVFETDDHGGYGHYTIVCEKS